MKTLARFCRGIWTADAFSPAAFVVRAVLLVALFGASELFGWRDYTTFLTGTSANLNVTWRTAATLGMIHLLLYFTCLLLAPICLIMAGLLVLWQRWAGRGKQ
jgi:hypothetical protein